MQDEVADENMIGLQIELSCDVVLVGVVVYVSVFQRLNI